MGSGGSCSAERFNLTAEDILKECGDRNRFKKLTALVTGATSGIGIETGRVLALAGVNVYLMGRSETKLREVIQQIQKEFQEKNLQDVGSIHEVICDLNSLISVKTCAEKLLANRIPLNLLILNAGVLNGNFAQTVDGIEQVIGVNHISQAYLTQLLMPTLVDNSPSRIVVVSSEMHKGKPLDYKTLDHMSSKEPKAQKGWGMISSYQQSKLANLLFARALTMKYKDQNITAYSLHPGVIDTNLMSQAPVANLFKYFFKRKTVGQGAATTIFCALKPDLEKESGRYFNDSTVTDVADKWTDDDLNTFWTWTENFISERTANL